MRLEFVEARLEHVKALRVRPFEREVYEKLYGDTLEHMLPQEINRSVVAYAALVDGKVGGLWGVKVEGILSDTGYLWFLGGHLIEQHPILFLRQCPIKVRELLCLFKRLEGYVLADYEVSKRWLKWLGFTIEESNGVVCRCWIGEENGT